LVGRKFFIKKS